MQKVGGTIVECNTAYGGGRASTENHLKAAADHGFTAIAPVDIMDAEGEVSLPVKGGRHLRENFVADTMHPMRILQSLPQPVLLFLPYIIVSVLKFSAS